MKDSEDAKQFCDKVLERARACGADYADIRVLKRDSEDVELRTGKVEG